MDIKVTVKLKRNDVEERLKSAAEKAVFAASEQALEDSNYYCKQDQSTLISSSQTHSEPEKGILHWKTPYARMQYYLDAARKDVNPNARKMWAHYAHSVHGKEWQSIFENAFRKFAKEKSQ